MKIVGTLTSLQAKLAHAIKQDSVTIVYPADIAMLFVVVILFEAALSCS